MCIHRQSVRLFLLIGFTMLFIACSSEIGQITSETKISYNPSGGVMTINGKEHSGDLAILPGGKIQRWALSAYPNHGIGREELEDLINDQVKVLIIGDGYQSEAFMTSEGESYVEEIKQRGGKFHKLGTKEAAKLYNSLPKEGLFAYFHMGC